MASKLRDDATTVINKRSEAASLEMIAKRLREEADAIERKLIARRLRALSRRK